MSTGLTITHNKKCTKEEVKERQLRNAKLRNACKSMGNYADIGGGYAVINTAKFNIAEITEV